MNNKYKTTEIYIKNRVIKVNISNHFQQRFIERIGYLDLNTIINNSWFYNPKTDILPKNVSSEIFHRTKKRGDFMYLINDDLTEFARRASNDDFTALSISNFNAIDKATEPA